MVALDLQGALQGRDFAAAHTILKLLRLSADAEGQWRAYLLWHGGDYEGALDTYRSLAAASPAGSGKSFHLHLASCLFQLRRFKEAQEAAEQGPECTLKTRLLAHCKAKLHSPDEAASANSALLSAAPSATATSLEQQLGAGKLDDQLSLAALLYARNDYAAAAAIYERLMKQFPDLHALHVYLALCCYMLDDWEKGGAHVAAYQAAHPDSALAANIWACNEFRAGDGRAALSSLGSLAQRLPQGPQQHGAALIRHNAVVFSGGEAGLQVLPPLVGVIPEARLNLVLFYCRRGDTARALNLLRGLDPATAFEHICMGVACALHGQAAQSPEHVRQARDSFMAVGSSPTELDTVPGRQCMASALLLGTQPEDALPYLESIADLCDGDDALSWNLGMARAAARQWAPAAEALQRVQRRDLLEDPAYQSWLVRCLIRADQPEEAWQIYLQAQQRAGAVPAVAQLLQLLGSECFLVGAFMWAARAFHALEYLQQQQGAMALDVAAAAAAAAGTWEGKRAACIAAFKGVVEAAVGQDAAAAAVLPELLGMLRGSSNPQAHVVAAAMKQWSRAHVPQALPETLR